MPSNETVNGAWPDDGSATKDAVGSWLLVPVDVIRRMRPLTWSSEKMSPPGPANSPTDGSSVANRSTVDGSATPPAPGYITQMHARE